eukprot:4651282-Prymnesium_polylepis.1
MRAAILAGAPYPWPFCFSWWYSSDAPFSASMKQRLSCASCAHALSTCLELRRNATFSLFPRSSSGRFGAVALAAASAGGVGGGGFGDAV